MFMGRHPRGGLRSAFLRAFLLCDLFLRFLVQDDRGSAGDGCVFLGVYLLRVLVCTGLCYMQSLRRESW